MFVSAFMIEVINFSAAGDVDRKMARKCHSGVSRGSASRVVGAMIQWSGWARVMIGFSDGGEVVVVV